MPFSNHVLNVAPVSIPALGFAFRVASAETAACGETGRADSFPTPSSDGPGSPALAVAAYCVKGRRHLPRTRQRRSLAAPEGSEERSPDPIPPARSGSRGSRGREIGSNPSSSFNEGSSTYATRSLPPKPFSSLVVVRGVSRAAASQGLSRTNSRPSSAGP